MKKEHNLTKAFVWFVISIISLVVYIFFDFEKLNIFPFAIAAYALLKTCGSLLKIYIEINSNN